MGLWGYSELDELLNKHPGAQGGFVIDTNILVSATYELDKYHDESIQFIESLLERKISLFCNVNIRSEFLEIHRRILFSEAILDFERQCNKALLPTQLSNDLNAFRMRYERRLKNKQTETPLKLSDSEIKDFKVQMIQIVDNEKDLWTELCEDRIGNKLSEVWNETESALSLIFLSLRKEDIEKHLNQSPEWQNVMDLMSAYGLSSSDAMILNMFLSSKFECIASSDLDLAMAVNKIKSSNKHCVVPDERKYLV